MTYTESARAQLDALQVKDHVRILALETSCDETAAAIIEDGRTIVSNIVFSQIDLHALYGGVVPEIASRAHVEACDRVIDEALRAANMRLQDVDALAVTYGPGLVGALLTGVSCMKGLSYAANKPLIPVNHIEGHVSANYISNPDLKPPFLCLVVSGGHSHIVRVNDYGDYTLLGQTMDDAAGEAFDKAARVLTLPYPGGPRIDALAEEGDPHFLSLPHPHTPGKYDYSFSGMKTAFLNAANKMIAAIPDFLQQTSILAMRRTKSGMKETDIRPLLVSLSGEGTAIHAVMALTETLACKPDMLLSALSTFCGLENAPDALIIRNGLLGRDENGELTPLENL